MSIQPTRTTLDTTDFVRKPRKDGTRPEKYYRVNCRCGHTTHLRLHDARNAVVENRQCADCQRAQASAKGFSVCAQKYGEDFAIKAVIKAQLDNPSKPERQIAAWLDELGVSYQRQVVVNLGSTRYIVDFMLADGKGIEGVGGYWHARNKQAKDELLAQAMIVLFITDDLVMNQPAEALTLITRFVNC